MFGQLHELFFSIQFSPFLLLFTYSVEIFAYYLFINNINNKIHIKLAKPERSSDPLHCLLAVDVPLRKTSILGFVRILPYFQEEMMV